MSKLFVFVTIIAIVALCAQADTQKWAAKMQAPFSQNNVAQYAVTQKHIFVISNTSLNAVNLATGSIAWSHNAYPFGWQYGDNAPYVFASEKMVVVFSQGTLIFIDPNTGNATKVSTSLGVQNVFFTKYVFVVGQQGYAAFHFSGEQAFSHNNENLNINCAAVYGNQILMMVSDDASDMWLINEDGLKKRTVSGVSLIQGAGGELTGFCTPSKDGYLIVNANPPTSSSSSSSTILADDSSSSSSSSSGNVVFAVIDINTGKYMWKKNTQPDYAWMFNDVVYSGTQYGGPLNAYDLTTGKLISTTSVSSNVQGYGNTAIKFDEKIAFLFVMGSGATNLTAVDPATGQVMNGVFVPSTSAYTFLELPDSFIVPNPQGLTRIDKMTMQPVYRTLAMSGMFAVATNPGGYLALYGSTIAYFTA